MKEESPDRMFDDGAWSTSEAMAPDAAYTENDEQYLLNDIGVALRLLSERD